MTSLPINILWCAGGHQGERVGAGDDTMVFRPDMLSEDNWEH